MSDRPSSWVDRDEHEVSGPGRPGEVASPGPEYSPAVEYSLLVGHPHTAAAIHVLDSIHSDVFPRSAVTMDGVDWAAIAEVRPVLSSGEQTLTEAAEDLDLVGRVGGLTFAEVRQRVDIEGNRRVRDARVMVGQAAPDPDREYDGDYPLSDSARDDFWDRP